MIGTRVGNYEIKAKLGEGGMGAVYLGEHPLIGRRVAVKVLLEEYVANETIAARFINEAKAANDIRHQNIVDILDFGRVPTDDGRSVVYIVMELLEGQSLADRLEARRLELAEIQHIVAQCCSGLAASHAKGIIHRDLKPDNLFLVRRGSDENFVKILDFGIAKLTVSAPTNAKTRTGTLIGTPAYMSPEQCAGRGQIDARSDVYSLGIVLYEMLTGRVPFKGEGFGDIVVAHLTEEPEPPSRVRTDLPAAWETVVLRALEKEPDKRFQSMDELALALADPAAYAASPQAVAAAGAAAAAPTTSVPVIVDAPSGPKAVPKAATDAATMVAKPPAQNTTLSGAASEVRAPRPASRARVALLVGGALTIAAAAVIVVGVRGTAHDAAPPAVTTPAPTVTAPIAAAPAPRAPEKIAVKVTSDPAGASVKRGDELLGTTPLTLELPKGAPGYDVTLALDGYRPETRAIASDVNREIDVNLLAEPHHGTAKAARHAATEKAADKPADKPAEKAADKAAVAQPADKKDKAPADKPKAPDDDKKLYAPEL